MIYKTAQLDNYIKKPDMAVKIVLLFGQNEGLIAEYTKKLIQTVSKDLYDPFCVVYLNGDDVRNDFGILSAEYNSQSLIGGRRVIVVSDVDNNFTKPITELLSSKSDTLLILYTNTFLNKKSSLYALGESNNAIIVTACYDDRDEDVGSSARKYLIENNITYASDAFTLLCSRLSNDRKFNINELDKLITYVGTKKHFEVADVKAVVFDGAVAGVDDLCFYTFSGEHLKALNSLKYLLNENVEEVTIVRGLIRHVNRLLDGTAFIENGDTPSVAIRKALPKNLFFRYDMGQAQLSVWNKERLFRVLSSLFETEKDCKTTNMPTTDILSHTILDISQYALKLKNANVRPSTYRYIR
jgi:DNA polymerase-3 subunit delta